MDTKESGRLGGLKRFANMTPKQVKRYNKKVARAAWLGHVKGDPICPCKRCKKKRAKNVKDKKLHQ